MKLCKEAQLNRIQVKMELDPLWCEIVPHTGLPSEPSTSGKW